MEPEAWFRQRGYLHFDRPVSFSFAHDYVTNPKRVEKHSFWPFLSYAKSVSRYLKGERRNTVKERPICYASHLDSHVYAYYSAILTQRYEERIYGTPLADAALAYRRLGKSNLDFAHEAFLSLHRLAQANGPALAIAFDVSAFFDTLDHSLVKQAWEEVLGVPQLPGDHYKVFRSITRFSTVERDEVLALFDLSAKRSRRSPRICTPDEFRKRVRTAGFVRTNATGLGIPQGSPMSAVLSNLYMQDFDRRMTALARDVGGEYRRYSDDILWICPAQARQEVLDQVTERLKAVGLAENSQKREESEFSWVGGALIAERPLQYLGLVYDGRRTLIRSQTLARYSRRMKRGVYCASRAADENSERRLLYRKKLYEDYTHLGRRNFISYAQLALRTTEDPAIRGQVRRHWRRLHAEIDRREAALSGGSVPPGPTPVANGDAETVEASDDES